MPEFLLHLERPNENDDRGETRIWSGEPLTIGRSDQCDWTVEDKDKNLSRKHLELASEDGAPFVVDYSANGVYLGDGSERLAQGDKVPIHAGDTLSFGGYRILIEEKPVDELEATVVLGAAAGTDDLEATVVAPSGGLHDAGEAAPAAGPSADISDPFEAFLEGAELSQDDVSAQSREMVMWLAGVMYRQMIEHLCDLMADRSAVRNQVRTEQTIIQQVDNNQFKVLDPETLKAALFDPEAKGFLDARSAVANSFEDVKQHQIAVLAGMQHALVGLLGRLDPAHIEESLADQKTMSVLAAGGKKAAAWDAFEQVFDQLRGQLADYENSSFMADFREGYERRMRQMGNR